MKSQFFKSSVENSLASSPDAAEHYKKDQDKWKEFTNNMINEVVTLFSVLPDAKLDLKGYAFPQEYRLLDTSFGRVYTFLAKKRHEIAQELQHGNDSGRTDWYGTFRSESFSSHEIISAADEKIWPKQKPKIFEQVHSIINSVKNEDFINDRYETGEFYIRRETHNIPIEDNSTDVEKTLSATIYEITIKSPEPHQIHEKNLSRTLCRINLVDFDDKSRNFIRIDYASVNKYDIRGDFHLADLYLTACRQANNLNDFLENAGRLCHLMASILPVKLGNSSIIELIVRSAAKERGIDLGPFKDNGLGWDFKAMLSPSREEYAKWYSENSYKNIEVLEPFQRKSPRP